MTLKKLSSSETAKCKVRLKKRLDILFAKMIRGRDRGLPCISCPAKGTQSGHFRRRELMSTRWHYRNSNLQCSRCNCWLSGNEFEYAIGLDKKFGAGEAKKIYKLSQRTKQWELWEIKKLIKACEEGLADYMIAYDSMKI